MTEQHDAIPASIRRRLYPVALAVAALAVAYGRVSESEAALWVALVVAIVGTGTATVYRPDPEG